MKIGAIRFFNNTWIPVILLVSTYFLYITLLYVQIYPPILPFFFVSSILVLAIALTSIISFAQKQWISGLTRLFIAGILGYPIIFFSLQIYLFMQPSEDNFADNFYIPENIEIEMPLESHNSPLDNGTTSSTFPKTEKQEKPTFNLINSFQPGLYESAIWINPGESGTIYLKAYEVTQRTPLSVARLKKETSKKVSGSNDPQELFYVDSFFTIYEGDWGKPYAAKFEVWFIPDSGKNEQKLLEKTFQIEGWQR